MRLFPILTLGLFWLAIMVTNMQTMAKTAGHHGCCTAFSKVQPENLMNTTIKRGVTVECRWQGITEGCSINAVVIKLERRQVCVNPTPRKMQKLLKVLCSNTKAGKRVRKPRRLHRKKTKISS